MNIAGARLAAWLGLAVLVAVLDQLSKYWAGSALDYAVPVALLPGLNFTLLHNTGAAFSLFADQPGWQRWVLSAIAFIVSVVVIAWLAALDSRQRWAPVALALILGGAGGNLIDRLLLGYVVDFIQVYYERWSWPAFNIADSAITVGAVMMIVRGGAWTAEVGEPDTDRPAK